MIRIQAKSKHAVDNFALENWLATVKRFDEPVFLLWSTEPTVMLGKYQDALAELNLKFVDDHHIVVTRRYSGGGTIYTDPQGCQFSFIEPHQGTTIELNRYIDLILKALNGMKIPAIKTSRNDLTVDGRKFSGNAQYNQQGYTVHHGSLLFNTNRDYMYDALHVDDLKLRSKHIASVRQRTINLQEARPDLTIDSFMNELAKQIDQLFDSVHEYKLTDEDRQQIDHLRDTIFANHDFIFNKVPDTELSKERYIKGGGLVKIQASVKKGQLTALHLTGDFFSNIDAEKLANSLVGRPFLPSALKEPLEKALEAKPIMGVTVSDLLDLLFS